MTRLVLVRHGESHWNAERRYQGQMDSGLTELGRDQAAQVGRRLVDEIGTPSAIWSSDLPRARDTSRPYSEAVAVPVVEDRRLREIDIGDWGGFRTDELAEEHRETVAAFTSGQDIRRGGGETFAELRARVVECLFEAVADQEGPVVVFCHGGAIQVAAAEAAGAPNPRPLGLVGPSNCSLTEFRLTPERFALVSYNRGLPAS